MCWYMVTDFTCHLSQEANLQVSNKKGISNGI